MPMTRFRQFAARGCRNFDSRGAFARQRGASLLEFAVVFAVGTVLAYALFEGVAFVRERSEKTLYEQTVAGLDAGLRYEAMSRHARGQTMRLAALEDENPFTWLQDRPGNYLGERDAILPGSLKSGHWAYDRGQYAVVYAISHGDRFRPASGSLREIRLRVSAQGPDPSQVRLVPTRTFRWLD